jgi:hypothetical protein
MKIGPIVRKNPEATPVINLPIPKSQVDGRITMQLPKNITKSMIIIEPLLPYLLDSTPVTIPPKIAPIGTKVLKSVIKDSWLDPQSNDAPTLSAQVFSTARV